jgi:hypothetical protein
VVLPPTAIKLTTVLSEKKKKMKELGEEKKKTLE